MNKLSIVALIVMTAFPAMAACDGDSAPVCETGNFAFYSGSTDTCLLIVNKDTGNIFGLEYPGEAEHRDSHLVARLDQGGSMSISSTGILVSCSTDPKVQFYPISAVYITSPP